MTTPNAMQTNTSEFLAHPNMRLAMVSKGLDLGQDIAGHILDASGLLRPDIKVLVVPTAANTPGAHESYISQAQAAFAGVNSVAVLHDYNQDPTPTQIEHEFGTADVIWFTGGRTQKAMPIFDRTGVSDAVKEASETKVISGGSAGTILQSIEAMSYDTPRDEEGKVISGNYVTIGGLALAKVVVSPHLTLVDKEPNELNELTREHPFIQMMNNGSFVSLSPNAPADRAARLILGIDNESSAFINMDGIRAHSVPGFNDHGISIYDRNDEGLYVVKARILPADGVVPMHQLAA